MDQVAELGIFLVPIMCRNYLFRRSLAWSPAWSRHCHSCIISSPKKPHARCASAADQTSFSYSHNSFPRVAFCNRHLCRRHRSAGRFTAPFKVWHRSKTASNRSWTISRSGSSQKRKLPLPALRFPTSKMRLPTSKKSKGKARLHKTWEGSTHFFKPCPSTQKSLKYSWIHLRSCALFGDQWSSCFLWVNGTPVSVISMFNKLNSRLVSDGL